MLVTKTEPNTMFFCNFIFDLKSFFAVYQHQQAMIVKVIILMLSETSLIVHLTTLVPALNSASNIFPKFSQVENLDSST